MFLLSSSVSFGISCCLKLTAPDFSHGKILQEVAMWGKLERPPLFSQFDIILKRGAFAHNCHLHGTVSNIPHSLQQKKIPTKYYFLILGGDNTVFFFSSLFVFFLFLFVFLFLFSFLSSFISSFLLYFFFYFMYCLFSISYIYHFL